MTKLRWFRWRFNKRSGPQPWTYEETDSINHTSLRALMENRVYDESSVFGQASAEWDFVKVPPVEKLEKIVQAEEREIKDLNETFNRHALLLVRMQQKG